MELKIGLLGTGVIGSGVVEIIMKNSRLIEKRTGTKLILSKVYARSAQKAIEAGVDEKIITSNYKEILEDKEINTIVELMGGYEPSHSMIVDAIKAGKNVVTANKAVIARFGEEIFREAARNNVKVNFEAAVAGCIPIIKIVNESYCSDKIKSIYGILNGTTNYIITRMEEGMTYDDALKKAQQLGFAEQDPTFDVEGFDAAQKLVILSRLAYNAMVPEQIPVFGISKLVSADFKYTKQLGYKIKLLAISKLENEELDLRVLPVLVAESHALANIKDEINAVCVVGEQVKDTIFSGRGAGRMPTATVVVSDIVDIARGRMTGENNFRTINIKNPNETESRFYIRIMLEDKPGVLANVAKILGDNNISINGVLQNEEDTEIVPAIITTHRAKRKDIDKALREIRELNVVKERPFYLMIEDF